MESMGVASGCGCKEVYRFPHNYLSLLLLYICSFLQQHPYFLFMFLNVFRSCSGVSATWGPQRNGDPGYISLGFWGPQKSPNL